MLKDDLKKADLLLLLFYIVYCVAVILRVHVEATGYLTPDSKYYLEAARSLRDGDRFLIRHLYSPEKNTFIYFTAWPVGYPVLITAASWLSGLDLFWASKVINLLFVGCGFLLLRHLCRAYSFVLASMYASFTVIEVYSYTWSEAVFLFGCLALVPVLHRIYTYSSVKYVYILLGVALFMFLNRYVGFFVGSLTLSLAIITRYDNRKKLSNHLFLAFTVNVFFVIGYILHNYYIAGHNTDLQRIHMHLGSIPESIWLTFKGLLIELFLIRNYYFKGAIDALTLTTTGFQIAVTWYLIRLLKPQQTKILRAVKQNNFSVIAFLIAVVYLAVLLLLRSISPFDPPDFRLLAPFTFLMLFAIIYSIVSLPDTMKGATQAKYLLFAFFILSMLLNLPKAFILSHIKPLL
jgi:hypothetical protein